MDALKIAFLLSPIAVLFCVHFTIGADSNLHIDYQFTYEPDSRLMAAKVRTRQINCYLYNMTEEEHSHIHTPEGMIFVEAKMLELTAIGNGTELTHAELLAFGRNLVRFCGRSHPIMLN